LDLFVPSSERTIDFPYKFLKLICDTPYRRQYSDRGLNYTSDIDRDWVEYRKKFPSQSKLIEDSSTYHRVRPMWKNVSAQIMKCDVPAVYPVNSSMDETMKLLHVFFRYIRSKPSHENEDHTYDLAKSPGLPYSKHHQRDKRSVLDRNRKNLIKYTFNLSYPVIDSYNDKDELLDIEDLARGKVRGVFGSSFHGIIREKFLYGLQNQKILEDHQNSWIKYGLVKQYGGFNKAIRSLEKFPFIWESDVSGYDRKIFLKFVYEIRNANIIDKELYLDFINSVTQSNVFPFVLLPNGYLIQRRTGNNSGKNNTTTDNSIAHKIIMVYMFVKRLNEIGKPVSLSYIFANVELLIYSDDKLGGMNLSAFEFETPQEFLDFEREVYSEFGLECKATSQVHTLKKSGDRVPEIHSFLGSFTHYDEGLDVYVPYPRFGKICSSLVRKYPNPDILIRFCRTVNLTVSCYPNKEVFSRALHYLTWFYNEHPKENYLFDEALKMYDIDINARSSFRRVYLGFESEGLLC